MTNPSQHSTRPDPQARGDEQPKNRPPDCAVIKLAHPWYYQTQYCRIRWFFHLLLQNDPTKYGSKKILKFSGFSYFSFLPVAYHCTQTIIMAAMRNRTL